MSPRVSVIMAVYNGAPYVAQAIDSVLAQTEAGWELLIVDDGSTDGTAAVLHRYAGRGAITVMQQPNAGVSAARNRAARAATAQWVAILDADDVWRPNYLHTLLPALQADPSAVAAFAGWQYLDAAGTPLPQTVVLPAAAARQLPEDLTWRNALVPSAAIVRRAALEQAGGFDPALAGTEDWDLWLRLAPLGHFIVIPQALVLYRTHAENTSDKIKAMEANILKLLHKHLGPLPADPTAGNRPQRRALGALFFNSALGYFRQQQPALAHAKLNAALSAWPAYVEQAEFYYELACAFQPRGRRGQPDGPALAEGADLLRSVLGDDRAQWGRACLVLARLAGDPAVARRYAAQAVWSAPWAVKPAALRTWLRAVTGRRRA